MDCREFRENHVGFVDDVLPAVDMEVMLRHVQSCTRCARHDLAVRRGLLIVRNLAPIEPSSDFMAKLSDRIAALEKPSDDVVGRPTYSLTTGTFAALAAGLTLFAYAALEASNRFGTHQMMTLPPVVATAPATPLPSLSGTAYMAGISTGMTLWPAVLMADEAPQSLANVELQQAALR